MKERVKKIKPIKAGLLFLLLICLAGTMILYGKSDLLDLRLTEKLKITPSPRLSPTLSPTPTATPSATPAIVRKMTCCNMPTNVNSSATPTPFNKGTTMIVNNNIVPHASNNPPPQPTSTPVPQPTPVPTPTQAAICVLFICL